MFLYNLTLQPAGAVTGAAYGNFSGAKAHEVVVARGKTLELLRPDEQGRVQSVCSVEVFGCVRSLAPLRLTGGEKDQLVVGSDSGRIVVLEFNADKNGFEKLHQETFGKSGCRRIVPGEVRRIAVAARAPIVRSGGRGGEGAAGEGRSGGWGWWGEALARSRAGTFPFQP